MGSFKIYPQSYSKDMTDREKTELKKNKKL